ncbi:hypothetical protein HK18_09815 [Commensalibacter intestini]|nr:hypothetical protein HK18_09815 [Commensalibacter intestini]
MYKTMLMSMALGMMVGTSVFAQGISFEHKDWQINCDNTRTCRAAGYSPEDDANRVTVLLTRKAGKGQEVSALVQLSDIANDNEKKVVLPDKMILKIGDQSYGDIQLPSVKDSDDDLPSVLLTAAQTKALLHALKGTAKISFVGGNQEWVLPGNGASAVLLKMDAEQGRVGTPSALIKQGNKSEDSVLPALPTPVIYQKLLPKGDVKVWQSKIDWVLLQKELVKIKGDYCDALENSDASFEPKVVEVLTYNRLLITGFCSSGAYHTNYGYWIIHQEQPYQPKLITMIGEDEMEDNTIVFRMKEDVLGDCWSHQSWVWNGKDFVQASNIPSAMCRMIAMGGAWDLPTYVSIVK